MELALSLGGDHHNTQKQFSFLEKSYSSSSSLHDKVVMNMGSREEDLGFCMGLGKSTSTTEEDDQGMMMRSRRRKRGHGEEDERKGSSDPVPVQLDLLSFSPVQRNVSSHQLRFPWLTENLAAAEPGLRNGPVAGKVLDMNRRPLATEEAEEGAALSSPNSAISNFHVDFSIYRNGLSGKRDFEVEAERGASSSRASDDEDQNGLARKKLRLTKDQSAFLEESFKEHNTLNPKQKLALSKQLNLRPRQIEVWFQNRRARTKLKQTEVDCEYLKRCCETLTEENRRLQKELQELRALKSSQPFYMQLPATTLTMCPSCERVATTSAAAAATTSAIATATTGVVADANTDLSLTKSKLFPFAPAQVHASQAAS